MRNKYQGEHINTCKRKSDDRINTGMQCLIFLRRERNSPSDSYKPLFSIHKVHIISRVQ